MSCQIGPLIHSFSYPFNLQRHSPNISISDPTPSPISLNTNNSTRMDSDDNSTNTQFFIQSHNLKFPILELQMNSKIPRPAHPIFCNTPSVHSTPQLSMNFPQPLLPTPTQPQFSLNDQRPTRPP